jgi:hypothetical protein
MLKILIKKHCSKSISKYIYIKCFYNMIFKGREQLIERRKIERPKYRKAKGLYNYTLRNLSNRSNFCRSSVMIEIFDFTFFKGLTCEKFLLGVLLN